MALTCLPGAQLKLNASCPGALVQADFLIRIQLQAAAYTPKLSFGHKALANKPTIPNITLPPGLDGVCPTPCQGQPWPRNVSSRWCC